MLKQLSPKVRIALILFLAVVCIGFAIAAAMKPAPAVEVHSAFSKI